MALSLAQGIVNVKLDGPEEEDDGGKAAHDHQQVLLQTDWLRYTGIQLLRPARSTTLNMHYEPQLPKY